MAAQPRVVAAFPDELKQLLDDCGRPWPLQTGARHFKLFVGGRLVVILPKGKPAERISGRAHKDIAATNGQCGGFLRTDIAPMLRPGDRVLYIGEYDLSGDKIEANIRRVLEQAIGGELRWERLALTQEQLERYRLPVITKRDKHSKDGHPHEAVETEAISQPVLIDILPRPGRAAARAARARREARQRRRIGRLLCG